MALCREIENERIEAEAEALFEAATLNAWEINSVVASALGGDIGSYGEYRARLRPKDK